MSSLFGRKRLVLSLFTVSLLGCGSDESTILSPLSTVTIRATLPDGTYLDTTFDIESRGELSSLDMHVSTEHGVAEVALPPGSYSVQDEQTGAYFSLSGPINDYELADLIEVTPHSSGEVEFRYASVSIRLRSPTGERVAWQYPEQPEPMITPDTWYSSAVARGDSVVEIAPLNPGEYHFGSDPRDTAWPPTWHPSSSRRLDVPRVVVGAGETRSIEITLLPPAFVKFECPTPERIAEWEPLHCVQMVGSNQDRESRRRFCESSPSLLAGPYPAGEHQYELDLTWTAGNHAQSARRLAGTLSLIAYDTTRVPIPSAVGGLEVESDPSYAELTLLDDEDNQEVATARGTPSILYAHPGEYRLGGTAPARSFTYWPRERGYREGHRLVIGDHIQQVEFTLVRLSTIQGRVVGEDGIFDQSLGSIAVRIQGATYSRTNQCDHEGNFLFRDEWPDEYRIVAQPRPESPFQETWFGNTIDPESAETVTLREGDHLHDLEIRVFRR